MKSIHISHYSDVLCVWAYVSQIRIDELVSNFGDQVEVEYLLFPVFGNAHEKIDRQWQDRGRRKAYSEHVQSVVHQFGHLPIHQDVWLVNAPHSSLPSHLYLAAAQLAESESMLESGAYDALTWKMRTAFFAEAQDIANISILREIIEEQQLPLAKLEAMIENGRAYAVLSAQMQRASDGVVRASPTLSFNEDRQRLTGNVGYRIIESNVRELLERPEDQQTWC